MGPDFSPYFEKVASDCFSCFGANKDNVKCIEVCNLSMGLVGKTQHIANFIENNLNGIVSCLLENLQQHKDMDLIKSFAEF
jgi:hypothetical protein